MVEGPREARDVLASEPAAARRPSTTRLRRAVPLPETSSGRTIVNDNCCASAGPHSRKKRTDSFHAPQGG